MKKRMILLFFVLCNLATIFFFSSQPSEISGALSDGISRKLEIRAPQYEMKNQGEKNVLHAKMQQAVRNSAHLILFCSLGFLVLLFLETWKLRFYVQWLGSALFCFLYALSDELHQMYVPGRSAELTDIGYDMLGVMIGMFLATFLLLIHRLRQRRNLQMKKIIQ